jgi:hypothetical protein
MTQGSMPVSGCNEHRNETLRSLKQRVSARVLRTSGGQRAEYIQIFYFVCCIAVSLTFFIGRAIFQAVVAGLSPRRSGFAPGLVNVGFVVNKVALGQTFLRVLRFLFVSINPPWLFITYIT